MSTLQYIFKTLRFYRKNNITVILGAAIATAVLVGALIIGDSVRGSLVRIAENRLQQTEYALQTNDRYVTPQLATKIAADLHTTASAVLLTQGMAIVDGGQSRANQVQVIGFDAEFFQLAAEKPASELAANEIYINAALAQRLLLKSGDAILLRIERPQIMPLEAPLAKDDQTVAGSRFTIKAILADAEFGNFQLTTIQSSPLNIFLPLTELQDLAELANITNVMLVASGPTLPELQQSLQNNFTLADASLHIKNAATAQLVSDRIFLDPVVVNAVTIPNTPVLTYLINEISADAHSTPYSFVSGIPNNLADDEIIINSWLAEDLHIGVGDNVTLTYFILGSDRNLVETSHEFLVKAVLPMQNTAFRADLMPAFPGLEEENCRDWDSGFPIDYDKIRDKDEKYWDDYRGTPKALINIKTAQKIWGNRFGDVTALEFSQTDSLGTKILAKMTPGMFGFAFQPVKQQAIAAAQQSTDFSQLFLGLSFFIIMAALILTALLFIFYTDKRRNEIALLKATGFLRQQIRRIILAEGLLLAFLGGIIGIPLGILYNQFVLLMLRTIWFDIVRTTHIQLVLHAQTLLIGFLIGFIISFFAILFSTNSVLKKQYSEMKTRYFYKHRWLAFVIACFCILVVVIILVTSHPGQDRNAVSVFFSAGFLLFIAGLSFFYFLLAAPAKPTRNFSLITTGLQNIRRNLRKNIAIIAILALGVFMVFMVGSNKTNVTKNSRQRSSGTGGFALFANTTMPILQDVNNPQVRADFDLAAFDSTQFIPFRVKSGDPASCLNLNLITQPQIIGCNPLLLDTLQAFTFTSLLADVNPQHPWAYLNTDLPYGAIPAFADQTVITWSLMKQLGDTLFYLNEFGKEMSVILAGATSASIFQGNLIISEKHLLQNFPSTSGYKIFLIDTPPHRLDDLQNKLSWAWQDYGVSIQSTVQRLAEFASITNTYLSIFLILGGLGLLLGTFGIGLLLMKTIFERQAEFGVMQALGFQSHQLLKIILAEYMPLLLFGILLGAFSAIIAALPALVTPGAQIPWSLIFTIFILLLIVGWLWIRWAALYNLKQNLIASIRKE